MTVPSNPLPRTPNSAVPPAPVPPPSPATAPRQASQGDPPSVLAVLGALHARQRLTGADLRQVSGLPRRTVYQALRILRERGDVQQRKSLLDTRQTYFWLAPADGGPEPGLAPADDDASRVASAAL